jgi:hypothetical protein
MLSGGPVVSVSKKAAHVSQSASHNEYMAITHCARHMAWVRDLLTELRLESMAEKPTPIYGDNRAANLQAHEDIVTSGNMFIQLPYHYTKQEIQEGNIEIVDIYSEDNISDLTTKAYSRQVADKLVPQMTGYDVLPPPALHRKGENHSEDVAPRKRNNLAAAGEESL